MRYSTLKRLDTLEEQSIGTWVKGLSDTDLRSLSDTVTQEVEARGGTPDAEARSSELDAKIHRLADQFAVERTRKLRAMPDEEFAMEEARLIENLRRERDGHEGQYP